MISGVSSSFNTTGTLPGDGFEAASTSSNVVLWEPMPSVIVSPPAGSVPSAAIRSTPSAGVSKVNTPPDSEPTIGSRASSESGNGEPFASVST